MRTAVIVGPSSVLISPVGLALVVPFVERRPFVLSNQYMAFLVDEVLLAVAVAVGFAARPCVDICVPAEPQKSACRLACNEGMKSLNAQTSRTKNVSLRQLPGQGFDSVAVHLIDLENLVGDPSAPCSQIASVWDTYAAGVPRTPQDLLIIGTSHYFAIRAWFVLPAGIRRVARDGRDGAESALLDAIDIDLIANRFGRLVIGSSDHIFFDIAMEARIRGMHVHQVTGWGTPARTLALAACSHSRLRLGGIHEARLRQAWRERTAS